MKTFLSLFMMGILCLSTNLLNAQDSISVKDSVEVEPQKERKKVEIVPFPYINYSNTLGFAYGLGGLVTFKMNQEDQISPRSTVGATYMRTTNKTWMTVIFAQLYFKEDQWRVVSAGGFGDYRFQTYMEIPGEDEGNFYPYSSTTDFFTVRLLRNLGNKNFVGLGYFYNKVNTDFYTLDEENDVKSNSLLLMYLGDHRNDVYYPTKGSKASVMLNYYPKWMGNNKNFEILNAYYNQYFPSGKNNVIAARAFLKAGSNNLDFQRQVVINSVDLRGYTDGKYRGDGKMDIQGEYRWNFLPRMGAVGFGGLATIYGSDTDRFNWKLYPSIGVGVRYLAVKSTKMRLGLDVARGKDEFAFYFRIGESF